MKKSMCYLDVLFHIGICAPVLVFPTCDLENTEFILIFVG